MITDHPSPHEDYLFVRPLAPVTLALTAGVALGAWMPGRAAAAVIVLLLSAGPVLRCIFLRRGALVWPLLFLTAAGYLSIQPWLGREPPAHHISRYAEQGKWLVGGIVDVSPQKRGPRHQFVLRADRLSRGQDIVAVTGRLRVSSRGDTPRLRRGDRVQVSGILHAVRGFCNPHGFDYERYMALQGLHARIYTPAERIRVEAAAQSGWKVRLDEFRKYMGLRMATALSDFSPQAVQLLRALTLGERSGLDDAVKEDFSRAGVSHILAISGLHIGMVAAAAFAFFRRGLAWLPPLIERAWVPRTAAALSLPAVFGYALLAGMSPSTQRALIMAAVFLMTFWIGRPHDWLSTVSAAAAIILVVSPPALMSVSFQLSFAAVLTILIGMRTLPFPSAGPQDTRLRRWSVRGVALVGVSLLAIWGTTPLVMRYFNQFCWVGPLSNLLVVPLVAVLIVPAGLLGIVCAPFSAMLSEWLWKAAALGLEVVLGWVEAIAGFDFAAVTTVTPSGVEMVLFYLLAAVVFLWKHRTVRIAGLIVVLAAGTLDAAYWLNRRFSGRRMIVTAVDVGQGSANVLQLPGGRVVLIDGGGFSDNNAFDIGRSVLAPFLWANKIKTIDLVVLSHANSDHLNGLLYILRHFDVGRVWSNHEKAGTYGYRQWLDTISRRGIAHAPFERLPLHSSMGPVAVRILAPPQDFPDRAHEPWRDLNNNSLVVRVAWKQISFLFTGDIMAEAEEDILARHPARRLQSTIMIVPHHGSRSSCTSPFIRAVRPGEAIIPAGWNNRFKFPHAEVLGRLDQAGCRIWRTDRCGAVTVVTDGETYRVDACRTDCR